MTQKQPKRKLNRRWLWIGGVALLLIVLFFVGRQFIGNAQDTANTENGQIVEAFVGDLSASASASGRVVAQRDARLSLSASGVVADIFVSEGDLVQAGDELLKLETADLERAVANAQAGLDIQEANLATLLAPASAADVAAAEAAVASVQANLNDVLDGPSQNEITAAEADVRAAEADITAAAARLNDLQSSASPEEIQAAQIALDLAQQAATQAAEQHSTILVTEPGPFWGEGRLADLEYSARVAAMQANADLAAAQETLNDLQSGDPNSIAGAQASVAVAIAQRDAAQARLDLLLLPPSEAQIAAAESNLAQAQANLDNLLNGPADWQITQAEAQVEQARINLQRAEENLAKATLTAPFTGVVTAVHVNEGEQAGGILVEMVDNDSLEVVLDVDEIDIGSIGVGQSASLTLEAWPDEEIESAVTTIAPRASESGDTALVTYEVYLSLGQTERPARVGMTANANLITAQREDVLLVPNAAIQIDRDSGEVTVNRVITEADGGQQIEAVPVTIGLRDGRYTQITGGLEAGDKVLVGSSIPLESFAPGPENQN